VVDPTARFAADEIGFATMMSPDRVWLSPLTNVERMYVFGSCGAPGC